MRRDKNRWPVDFYQDRAVAFFDKKNYAECWQDVQQVEKMGGHPPQFMAELKKHLGRT